MDGIYARVEMYTASDIHTRPFGSVQDTLSVFEPNMYLKYAKDLEANRDEGMRFLIKDLANCKLQLDVIESDNIEAHLKLEVFCRIIAELSERLKSSEAESERHSNESKQDKHILGKLQARNKMIAGQLLECFSEDQEQTLVPEAEFDHLPGGGGESKGVISMQPEFVDENNIPASGEDDDELTEKQLLLEKIILTDCLMLELKQQKESNSSYAKATSDAFDELNRLIGDMEVMEAANSEKSSRVISMDDEINRLQEALRGANEEAEYWRCQAESARKENHELSRSLERDMVRKEEVEALKSELRKSRSKVASVEASRARALSAQSGMYLAVQQLAQELEAAKNKGNELRKLEAEKKEDRRVVLSMEEYLSLVEKAKRADMNTSASSREIQSEETNLDNDEDVELKLKAELDAANERIDGLRFGLQEALRRVVLSEKAKSSAEDQLKKLRKNGSLADPRDQVRLEQVIRGNGDGWRSFTPMLETKKTKQQNDNVMTLGKMLNLKH